MTALPKVYVWCNSGAGTDWQIWVAMHEDGTVLGQHCSSARAFGIGDVQPPFKRALYAEHLGTQGERGEGYELVVCPEGEGPPPEVAERNRAQGEETEKAETESDDAGPMGDGPSFAHDVQPLEEELKLAADHPEYGIDVPAVEAALAEARKDAENA